MEWFGFRVSCSDFNILWRGFSVPLSGLSMSWWSPENTTSLIGVNASWSGFSESYSSFSVLWWYVPSESIKTHSV